MTVLVGTDEIIRTKSGETHVQGRGKMMCIGAEMPGLGHTLYENVL